MAMLLLAVIAGHAEGADTPVIEVTGSATMNIIPDRITIEIGMEEYYKHKASGDSTIVKLYDIEKDVRKTLREAGVPDSMIPAASAAPDAGGEQERRRPYCPEGKGGEQQPCL